MNGFRRWLHDALKGINTLLAQTAADESSFRDLRNARIAERGKLVKESGLTALNTYTLAECDTTSYATQVLCEAAGGTWIPATIAGTACCALGIRGIAVLLSGWGGEQVTLPTPGKPTPGKGCCEHPDGSCTGDLTEAECLVHTKGATRWLRGYECWLSGCEVTTSSSSSTSSSCTSSCSSTLSSLSTVSTLGPFVALDCELEVSNGGGGCTYSFEDPYGSLGEDAGDSYSLDVIDWSLLPFQPYFWLQDNLDGTANWYLSSGIIASEQCQGCKSEEDEGVMNWNRRTGGSFNFTLGDCTGTIRMVAP